MVLFDEGPRGTGQRGWHVGLLRGGGVLALILLGPFAGLVQPFFSHLLSLKGPEKPTLLFSKVPLHYVTLFALPLLQCAIGALGGLIGSRRFVPVPSR